MPNDTLTIALNGEISLRDFSASVQQFHELVSALSDEVGDGVPIEWVVDDLEAGSAIATIRGVSDRIDVIEKVVAAYGVVGHALETRQPIPYSDKVQKPASALTRIIDGRVNSIRFETNQTAATVVAQGAGVTAGPAMTYAVGTIKGRVESLTKRHRLRFTVYDLIFDKAVNCYLKAGQEEEMRNIWGKKVVVTGRIGRDPRHGQPVEMRDIRDITVVEEHPRGSYKLARGVAPVDEGVESAEAVIRRLRDAS